MISGIPNNDAEAVQVILLKCEIVDNITGKGYK
jgi:hypothetical protein